MRAFVNACDVFLAADKTRDAILTERKRRIETAIKSEMQRKAWRWTSVHQTSPEGYGTGRYVWRLRWRVRSREAVIKDLDYPGSPYWVADAYCWNREIELTKIINLCRALPNGAVVSITPEDFNLFKVFYKESMQWK